MTIRKAKTSQGTLELWDDEFGRNRMYMVVAKDPEGWIAQAVYGERNVEIVGEYRSAGQAIKDAEKYMKAIGDELDEASSHIPEG